MTHTSDLPARGPLTPSRICIVANSAWYLFNFRLELARRLRALGHELVFVANTDKYASMLEADGFQFRHWAVAGAGKNPIRELKTIIGLRQIFQEFRPTHVFSYTPKANIYSGLALTGLAGRFFPNVSGLGRVFIRRGPLTHIATLLYKLAFRRSKTVIFQNADDQQVFLSLGITHGRDTLRVPGSGVDLQRFRPSDLPALTRGTRQFLFVGRLLTDKGIVEYVKAAAAIRQLRSDCEFVVVGSTQSNNPAAIEPATVKAWVQQGVIRHVEHVQNVLPYLHESDCVVLPSYREGVPRSLLEAAAAGRPIITTDAPGCRDVVIPGETGLLCKVRDEKDLERAMLDMLSLEIDAWTRMGQNGRSYMERRFSEDLVIARYEEFLAPFGAARNRGAVQ